jgi:signal transduction histidine kinase/CheY-like chemotaxis protein
MLTIKEKFALKSIRAKIIMAFLFGCTVVLLSWLIAKVVFRETFLTIEKIGQPNPKLRIVNALLLKVHNLDQVQRMNIIQNAENAQSSLISESKSIIQSLDTLQMLYADDSLQVKRLEQMKDVLLQRDKLFLKYLKFHEELIRNKSLSSNMRELSDYISTTMRRKDSSLVTTRKKTTTTTLDLPKEEASPKKQESFFKRLFSRKKSERKSSSKKQVTEDVITTTDTLAIAQRDSFMKDMEAVIGTIEKDQFAKGTKLVNHELKLANASNTFINELQLLLYQVQEEEIAELQDNTLQLSDVFNRAFSKVGLILLVFLVLTVVLIFLMFSDLSQSNRNRLELIEAKEKAQYMEKVKERFLANMSHEIRTPLQSIIGYSELLKNQGTEEKEYVEAIYRSSEYLLQIVNEVLDYSRITSGKFKFDSANFSMEEVLAEVADTIESQAEIKNIQFKFKSEIPEGVIHKGDSFRLKQILYNLLSNALKFTEHGQVQFMVSSKSDAKKTQFIFEVKDTGIGLDEEQIKKIFNAFEQASESTQRFYGGTGLGLSITKTLVEMQRGHISVKSEKNVGTTFTVTLGYLKSSAPDVTLKQEIPESFSGFAGKVLVVDDDALILKLCSLILTKHHIAHICYNSPEKVLAETWDPSVTIALIDIRMPNMNGIELCAKLKQKTKIHPLFVALTAEVLPDEIEQILTQGFDRILLKPFREKDLLGILHKNSISENKPETKVMTEFDLDSLKLLCNHDPEQLQQVLSLMHVETVKDIMLLKTAFNKADTYAAGEIIHKLAARAGQAGAHHLSVSLRQLELHYKKGILSSETALVATGNENLIIELELFAKNLENALNA